MAKGKYTYQQIVDMVKLIIFAAIFGLAYLGFNYMSSSVYGIQLQNIPEHDTPQGCQKKEYQICTTAIGTCTKNKKQCVLPQSKKSKSVCKYIWFVKSKKRSQIPLYSIYEWFSTFTESYYRYTNYCGSPILKFYNDINTSWRKYLWYGFESIVTAIVFFLMYPQINYVAEKIVF